MFDVINLYIGTIICYFYDPIIYRNAYANTFPASNRFLYPFNYNLNNNNSNLIESGYFYKKSPVYESYSTGNYETTIPGLKNYKTNNNNGTYFWNYNDMLRNSNQHNSGHSYDSRIFGYYPKVEVPLLENKGFIVNGKMLKDMFSVKNYYDDSSFSESSWNEAGKCRIEESSDLMLDNVSNDGNVYGMAGDVCNNPGCIVPSGKRAKRKYVSGHRVKVHFDNN